MTRRSLAVALLALNLALMAPGAGRGGYPEAVEAFNRGEFDLAEEEFRQVVELHPEYGSGHLMLGRALLEQGEVPEALASLGRAVELEPEETVSRYFLGRAQLEAGSPGAALEVLTARSLAEVPDKVRAAYAATLAQAAKRIGGDDGVEALEKAVDQTPELPVLWLTLGRLHREAGRPGQAFVGTETAFGIAGDPAVARIALRDAFAAAAAEGDREARREWYRRGVTVAKRLVREQPEPASWLLLGEARMGAGECEAAVEAFREADPADAHTRFYLGSCALRLGNAGEALTELRVALENDPDPELERSIHAALGAAHRHREEFVEAAAAYRLAGDSEKVAEMEELAEVARTNRTIEKRRRRCRERQRELEQVVAENRDLEGTPEFTGLRRSWHELRVECADVLEIPPFPEGA